MKKTEQFISLTAPSPCLTTVLSLSDSLACSLVLLSLSLLICSKDDFGHWVLI